jgi:tagaturonate reductase
MHLSKKSLKKISASSGVAIPGEDIFSLPEKVLQFGTGVLLRGLPDYFIDKANRQGIFNGRIVVVKSTTFGSTDEFEKQDQLYTLCLRGLDAGKKVEEFIINSSISRVLSAKDQWSTILECAHNSELKIIISNTTEVGIALTNDDVHASPPHSFPGKLLSFLFERYKAFGGAEGTGMVIIPTELIVDNGTKLRSAVLELARMNELDEDFVDWLKSASHFCSSLVDRIVPGKLQHDDQVGIEQRLGYKDALMIMAENFGLWAIETDNRKVKELLSFARADEGVVIESDIEIFRELKLRLLNGTHSFSCGLGLLAGFETVKEAMADSHFLVFVKGLAQSEIAVAMSDDTIPYADACDFAGKIIDRFRNPFIDHPWINIAVQYTEKMKQRNIPLLLKYYQKFPQVPEYMALGFAAFLLFMKCHKNAKQNFVGTANGIQYLVQDDHAQYFADKWANSEPSETVEQILRDEQFWGTDLSLLNGFADSVKRNVLLLMHHGAKSMIQQMEFTKTIV